MTPDEQIVREFLRPLRGIEPVTRPEAPHRAGRRILISLEMVGVALGVAALVALVALLGHRSSAPPPARPRPRPAFTFLFNGGILEHPVVGQGQARGLVGPRHIRAFGWSPDGRRVAYVAGNGPANTRCQLQVVEIASGRTTTLARWAPRPADDSGCDSVLDRVAWSPGGRYIAYSRRGRLGVVEAATGRMIASGVGLEMFTWWPGGRIAFVCGYRSNIMAFGWCSIRPDGSDRRRLAVHGNFLTWSPAAGRIAYLRDPKVHSVPHVFQRLQVWTANTDGSDPRLLVTQPAECCVSIVPTLAWSPDGTRLVASGAEAQVIDAATGAHRRIVWWPGVERAPVPSWEPAWRP